jgi:hypothetical protein
VKLRIDFGASSTSLEMYQGCDPVRRLGIEERALPLSRMRGTVLKQRTEEEGGGSLPVLIVANGTVCSIPIVYLRRSLDPWKRDPGSAKCLCNSRAIFATSSNISRQSNPVVYASGRYVVCNDGRCTGQSRR